MTDSPFCGQSLAPQLPAQWLAAQLTGHGSRLMARGSQLMDGSWLTTKFTTNQFKQLVIITTSYI